MKRLLLASAAVVFATGAQANGWMRNFCTDPTGLNIRSGTNMDFPIHGAIPPGEFVMTGQCKDMTPWWNGRQFVVGAPWCHVNYHGIVGWASTSCLEPAAAEIAAPVVPAPGYAGPVVTQQQANPTIIVQPQITVPAPVIIAPTDSSKTVTQGAEKN